MKVGRQRRRKNSGFTLVEIIVVLVILAVIAAFTIPTMIGFVNDAKAKASLAEAHEVYTAAQATVTEYVSTNQEVTADSLSSYAVTHPGTVWYKQSTKQLKSYLGNDLIIAENNVSVIDPHVTMIDDGESAWLIEFDKNSAKVTQVFYVKNPYAITIKESVNGENEVEIEKLT